MVRFGSPGVLAQKEIDSLISERDNSAAESTDNETASLLVTNNPNTYSNLDDRRKFTIVLILFLANLLNYFDRSSLNGILINVQQDFGMNDKGAALVSSIFLVAYMIFSPLFGFLGDHYSRKWLIVLGLLFWSVFTLLGSYVPSTSPVLFYLTRSLVGIGEASLSTLGFPLVGDMFEGALQTRMLAFYQLALPLGNGIGYIVSTAIQKHYGNWRYVLRLTPGVGLFVSFLCAIFIVDIPYQKTEEDTFSNNYDEQTVSTNVLNKNSNFEPIKNENKRSSIFNNFCGSIWTDLKYFFTIKSFILSTFGFAETAFVMGIMQVWIPTFMTYAGNFQGSDGAASGSQLSVGLIFGASCIVCGLLGTVVGSEMSNYLRKYTKNAETYLCAVFLFVCSFCCYLGIVTNPYSIGVSWLFTYFGVFFICVTWIPNSIILMSVISIRHRGLASALQILLIHAIGDAISPFIVGMISDFIRYDNSNQSNYSSLYHSLLICPYFMMIAASLYLWSSFYYPQDKETMLKKNEQIVY